MKMGFGAVLFLILMTLKLTNYIDWSWLWVSAPLWLPITVVLGVCATAGLVAFLVLVAAWLIEKLSKK